MNIANILITVTLTLAVLKLKMSNTLLILNPALFPELGLLVVPNSSKFKVLAVITEKKSNVSKPKSVVSSSNEGIVASKGTKPYPSK